VTDRLRLACSDIDARPLFWNEGTTRHGYEPAAAQAVADALGVELEWVYTPWDDRWPAVLAGDADAVWCGMAMTPERQQTMQFSAPYAMFNESLVTRVGSGVSTPAQTTGMRIGVPANSTNEKLARSWDGAVVVPFAGHDDVFTALIDALVDGSIDGIVDDEPALVPLTQRDPRLELAFSVPTRHRWGAAMRPGSDDLAALINTGIAAALASGSLARHWERHLPFLDFPLGQQEGTIS
jgi:polar amino acid transport system substrate-binding protein